MTIFSFFYMIRLKHRVSRDEILVLSIGELQEININTDWNFGVLAPVKKRCHDYLENHEMETGKLRREYCP